MEEFDPTVKEAAGWAIGYIAQHNAGKNRRNAYNERKAHAFDGMSNMLNGMVLYTYLQN